MKKVVLATGGFDPLHSGHIEYLKCAASMGDVLIVGLNSDDWLTRKKGRPFQNYYEREQIVSNLGFVHNVINFDDHDDTAIEAILKVKRFYKNDHIIFANGGIDRRIRIFRLPDENPHQKLTLERRMKVSTDRDNAYYVRITQEDGHFIWSSPIYVFK